MANVLSSVERCVLKLTTTRTLIIVGSKDNRMPLDWEELKNRYSDGGSFESLTGSREFSVNEVTDDAVIFKTAVSQEAVIEREGLEEAVEAIESGEMPRDPDRLLEAYKNEITHSRATTTVCLLADLGYTEA